MPRILAALFAWIAAACSTVPPGEYPPYEERHVQATFLGRGGAEVQVPASAADLTVLELACEPAAASEHFAAGRRHLVVPDGCQRFVVRMRYRAYAAAGRIATPRELFPDAAELGLLP
jgi:hypothetical protein